MTLAACDGHCATARELHEKTGRPLDEIEHQLGLLYLAEQAEPVGDGYRLTERGRLIHRLMGELEASCGRGR